MFGGATGARGQDLEQIRHSRLGRAIESNLRLRIGDGALELLHDRCRFIHEVDDSGIRRRRLRHLGRRILKVGDLGAGLGRHGLGKDEGRSESVIEALGDVAGDFDVLTLIFAHRHFIGVVEEDVGGLESGVGEESGRDEIGLALGGLVLELRHTAQFTERDGAFHDPTELGVLGNVTLHEDRRLLGVESDGEQSGGEIECARTDDSGAIGHGEGVEIDDSVERVAFGLTTHPIAKGTEIVAEVHRTGGLDARQNSGHGLRLTVATRGKSGNCRPADYSRDVAVDVTTPVFEGPFDLLLHLILKEQVDIYEVHLANIVDAYLTEIERMQSLDLELATEFLLIAATLVELKARRLLPGREDVDLDEELALWEERDLLLARLLECKTFKDVGRVFAALADDADRCYARACGPDERFAELMPDLLEGVKPRHVHAAYLRATAPKPEPKVDLFHVGVIKANVSDALAELVDELPRVRRITFRRLTADLVDRLEIIVRFLALLELYKQGFIELEQGQKFGDIDIVWIADQTGVSVGAIAIDDYEG